MPGLSSNGYPVPLDTDPVADAALAVRNLAEGIPRIERHDVEVIIIAGFSTGFATVEWDTPGATPPTVAATVHGANYVAQLGAVTVDDGVIRCSHIDGDTTGGDVLHVDVLAVFG